MNKFLKPVFAFILLAFSAQSAFAQNLLTTDDPSLSGFKDYIWGIIAMVVVAAAGVVALYYVHKKDKNKVN